MSTVSGDGEQGYQDKAESGKWRAYLGWTGRERMQHFRLAIPKIHGNQTTERQITKCGSIINVDR